MHFISSRSALSTCIALTLVACGEGLTAEELNQNGGTSSTAPQSTGTGAPTMTAAPTTTTAAPTTTTAAPTTTTTAATAAPTSNASTQSMEVETTSAPEMTTAAESTDPMESTAPAETSEETTSAETTSAPEETTEPVPEGPYAARTGSFKMLVLSKTAGWRHTDSIQAGQQVLTAMATQQGFEAEFTETTEKFTVEGLSQYEIVFFLNTTGGIFSATEKAAFQEWMTMHDGAFAGIHSATDTENGWGFYSEVTGQYYNGHSNAPDTPGEVQWDPAQIGHVAVQGLPSPWSRQEEWYKFNQSTQWATKAGFVILGRVSLNDDGGSRPVSFTREWSNFRSFYTSLGHAGTTVSDANFKKHLTGGVMWAVRREALIK